MGVLASTGGLFAEFHHGIKFSLAESGRACKVMPDHASHVLGKNLCSEISRRKDSTCDVFGPVGSWGYGLLGSCAGLVHSGLSWAPSFFPFT